MLLALALYASTAPAGVGGTPGVLSENTSQYDLELLYHDGRRTAPVPVKNSIYVSRLRLPSPPPPVEGIDPNRDDASQ